MRSFVLLRRRLPFRLLTWLFAGFLLAGLAWSVLRPSALSETPSRWGGPQAPLIVVAGGAPGAPPYTLPAFRRALAAGALALELPLQFTADGEPVVYPYPEVGQTTDGQGPVSLLTLARLQSLDAGYRFTDPDGNHPFRGHGLQVPLLEEVLAAFPGVSVLAEVVDQSPRPDHLERLARIVRRWGVSGMILLSARSPEATAVLRRLLPETPSVSTVAEAASFLKLARWGLPALSRPPFRLLAAGASLTPAVVRAAHRSGLAVLAGPVASPEEARHFLKLGVDILITSGAAAFPLPPPARPAVR